jgi:hypothetical protein
MPPQITAPFASRFARPGIGSNPQESLGVLRALRPTPAPEPEMPAPGTDLGGGVTHIGQLDDDPFYGGSAASAVKRSRYFADADLDQAISGLTRQAGFKRSQRLADQADADYDLQYNAPGRANLQANVADVTSERGAQRAFLPGASAVYDRTRRDTMADAQTRYLLPAQLQAEGALGAAELRRQGQVEAAQARTPDPNDKIQSLVISGLINAMQGQVERGQKIDPMQLNEMLKYLSPLLGQQPQPR